MGAEGPSCHCNIKKTIKVLLFGPRGESPASSGIFPESISGLLGQRPSCCSVLVHVAPQQIDV